MNAPRLVACYFGTGAAEQWPRMARVLEYTARQHCPSWQLEIRAITPPPCRGATGSAAHVQNTQKLDDWVQLLSAAQEGDRLALLDADTMILRPLDPVWALTFDVAYTTRPPGCKLPFNAGVVFVRVSDRVRAFLEAWRQENQRMLCDRRRHDLWRKRYGGINQAALGAILEQRDRPSLQLAQLPCREWNCEDSSWEQFDPQITRIVHIKSGLRRALFLHMHVAQHAHMVPLVKRWRELERAAVAAERQAPPPQEVLAVTARAVAHAPVPQRPRGRPRTSDPDSIVTSVSIPRPVYDAYCRHALTKRESVRSVIQRAISSKAPAP